MAANELESKLIRFLSLAGFICQRENGVITASISLQGRGRDYKLVCIVKHEEEEQPVRELIFEWVGKRKDIEADKVIFLLDGIEVLGEERYMAMQHGFLIWHLNNLNNLADRLAKDKEDGVNKLMGLLGIETYIDPNARFVKTGPT